MNSYKATLKFVRKKDSFSGSSGCDQSVGAFNGAEKTRVLVLERAVRSELLIHHLKARGYLVLEAFNGTEALAILGETAPDLILIGLSSKGIDDWQLLKAIRAVSDAPIVGRIELDDAGRINEGLELGIDDYVSRSADAAELDARIRVALLRSERFREERLSRERRSGADRRKTPLGRRKTDQHRVLFGEAVVSLKAGPFKIDDRNKRVTVEGEERELSPKEYTLLKLLVAAPGRVYSNEEIIASLWPDSSRATTSDVQQYVHLLRTKVEKNPKSPRWIKTVKGFGYRLASAATQ